MSCVPEDVSAYLDDELEAQHRARVAEHLTACPACAGQERAERELRDRLRQLPSPEPPPGLELSVRRRLKSRARARRHVRWMAPLAASLLMGLLGLLWGRSASPFVAWELARDHRHCMGYDRPPAKVWSSDVETVTRWFAERGRSIPRLPAEVNGLTLVGARLCPLADRRVAHIYYVAADRRVSLYVVPEPLHMRRTYHGRSGELVVHMQRVASRTVGVVAAREDDARAFAAAFDHVRASWRPTAAELPASRLLAALPVDPIGGGLLD